MCSILLHYLAQYYARRRRNVCWRFRYGFSVLLVVVPQFIRMELIRRYGIWRHGPISKYNISINPNVLYPMAILHPRNLLSSVFYPLEYCTFI